MKTVLVAGGTGLVGKALVKKLHETGHGVRVLSTRQNAKVEFGEIFTWNPDQLEMPAEAVENVHAIVNLAGANVSQKWTPVYKQEIVDSRTKSAHTIAKALRKVAHNPNVYVSASGINYYPDSLTHFFTEENEPGNGFLAQVCQQWELGADQLVHTCNRVVKLRIGAVLSRQGGALKKIEPLAKLGINSPVGRGSQWFSWIHITDLVNIILHAISNENMDGVYNAVAPTPVTNTQFTKALAKALKRPAFLPKVPARALQLALGDMSSIILEGQNCSAQKLKKSGFQFTFIEIHQALENLYA